MFKDRFSTREVVELTGATARQLQWWDEQRVVVPVRDGRKRVYSHADLIDILTIEELRRRRISLQQIRRVLRFLRSEFRARLADLVGGLREQHLLLDGKRVYLETDANQIVDLLRNTRQPVLLVCLSDVVRKLRVDLAQLKESRTTVPRKAATATQGARLRKEVG
jgi:DNA-binding transcriptional MerR regulator